MMEGWKEYKLKDVFHFYNGKAVKAKEFGKYPIYGSNGQIGYTDEYKFKKSIIIGRVGAYCGAVFYENDRFWASDNTIVVNEKDGFDIEFLSYLISLINLNWFSGGSAQPLLTHGWIKPIKITIPHYPTQRKIAKILSAYDDLIENNLKRIKLLEEMAQITYEEWFVRMKFPGHENTPINKETGLPEGWEKVKLGKYINIRHGYAYKGEFFIDKETSRILLTPGNFRIGGGMQLKKIKYYSDNAECPSDYVLKKNELLVTMTDLSKMGDTLGYPLLVPSSDKIFLHNQRLGKVQIKKDDFLPKYFFYFLFKDERYRAFVVGASSGATVKHTSPSKILAFKALIPPLNSELLEKFESTMDPLFETIDNLYIQNQRLKEARDILLPRLMTGMVDVDEIVKED